ncbi:MAG: hypothetical protein IPK80_19810 [Nannocystis sp.]|nr:hypothetical protein [Nannocystis sp.]
MAQSHKLKADLIARGHTREQAQVHVRTHQCLVALLAAVAVLYGPEARIDATNLLKPTIIITAQDRPVLLYTATLNGATITRPGGQSTIEIEQRLHDIRRKLAAELAAEPCQGDHAQAIRRALARLQRPDREATEQGQRLLAALANQTEAVQERLHHRHVNSWVRAALDHLRITIRFDIETHESTSAVIYPTELAYEAWRDHLRVMAHALTLRGAPALTLDLTRLRASRIGDEHNAELDRIRLDPTRRALFSQQIERAILRGLSPAAVLRRARKVAKLQERQSAEGGATHG